MQTSKNALATLMIGYGDPKHMVARHLRSADEEANGPFLSDAYTEAMMGIVDRVGLYDTPIEPIHLRTPTALETSKEEVVDRNPHANLPASTYTRLIEDIL